METSLILPTQILFKATAEQLSKDLPDPGVLYPNCFCVQTPNFREECEE